MGDLTTITKLSQTLTILSSMIAPVVLILACGSLIANTSQRLAQVIERCRSLIDQLKEVVKENAPDEESMSKESALLFYLVGKASHRSRLLQVALTTLYISLGMFIATSISLGILNVINSRHTWFPVALSMLGALMLLYTSVLLITESSLARRALNRELDEALSFFKQNLDGLSKRERRRWWRRTEKQAAATK